MTIGREYMALPPWWQIGASRVLKVYRRAYGLDDQARIPELGQRIPDGVSAEAFVDDAMNQASIDLGGYGVYVLVEHNDQPAVWHDTPAGPVVLLL